LKPCILNATSSVPSPSKCTKIVGGWCFAPTPLWELTALPRPSSWIKKATSKVRGKRREGKRGEGRVIGEVTGGTLDPHNVGNRLTPLLPLMCTFSHCSDILHSIYPSYFLGFNPRMNSLHKYFHQVPICLRFIQNLRLATRKVRAFFTASSR